MKKDSVVSEFNIGKTKIKICDDYCRNKSKSDVEEIINRISQNVKLSLKVR